MEECGELTRACSKVLRFGGDLNWAKVYQEKTDVDTVFTMMEYMPTTPAGRSEFERRSEKLIKLVKYMEESIKLGILDK